MKHRAEPNNSNVYSVHVWLLAMQNDIPNDRLAGISKSKTGLKHDKNSSTHNASPTASDGIFDSTATGFGKS